MVSDIVGGGAPGKMISCSSDLTFKNVYGIGSDEIGYSGGYYQPSAANAVGKDLSLITVFSNVRDFSIIA